MRGSTSPSASWPRSSGRPRPMRPMCARGWSRAASPLERNTSPTSGPARRWPPSGGRSRSSRGMRRRRAGSIGSAGAIACSSWPAARSSGWSPSRSWSRPVGSCTTLRSASTRGRRRSASLNKRWPSSRARAKSAKRNPPPSHPRRLRPPSRSRPAPRRLWSPHPRPGALLRRRRSHRSSSTSSCTRVSAVRSRSTGATSATRASSS